MIVSLYSLRQVYSDNISIFYPTRDKDDHEFAIGVCKQVASIFDCNVQEIDPCVPAGKNRVFLERTKYHEVTPYDVSLSIDSDTVVLDARITDYLDKAEKYEFVLASFAEWKTHKGTIAKRIKYWEKHFPDVISDALEFGPGINCGCFAFRKDAEMMGSWYDSAVLGRESFICDETCMQVLLPHHEHWVMPSRYNTSCKYDQHINDDGYPIMVHFHGKKHCRIGDDGQPKHNSEYWLYFFERCINDGVFDKVGMDVLNEHYGDKMYRRYKKSILEYIDV